jgi:hypothetical protein
MVNDADLNQLAYKAFAWPDEIRGVRFAIIPEGIRVTGTYQQFVGIPFQILWQLSVAEGKVIARIERVKAGFMSLGLLKRYLLNLIAAATSMVTRDEMLILDVDALFMDKGWPLRVNLSSMRCSYGNLTLESCKSGSYEDRSP